MATENKKYIPALRFPEFQNDGEWKCVIIGDIINTINPPKKLQSSEYKKKGAFPIVDQSASYIAGYSDNGDAVIDNNGYNYIVFGDHTCSLKLIDFPFIQGADGIKIFKSKITEVLTEYLYQYIFAHPINSKEYKRHFSDLKEKLLLYPTKACEQKKIADCLSSLDNYIDATKRKLELLKEHKKGLMQRLFPAKGKTTPEIRFPEFQNDGEWKCVIIGDIISTINPPKKLQSSEYKKKGAFPIVDQSASYIAGYSDNGDAVIDNNGYNYIVFGDHTCSLKLIDFPFIQGADGIKIFKSKITEVLTEYLYQYIFAHPINSKEYKRHFSDLKEKLLLYPTKACEQKKIADCLSSLDNYIDATKRKLELLKEHKKGLMQQLFPKL